MNVGVAHLATMFGVVAFGAVVPVVPTGAAVSVTAVLSNNLLVLAAVVLVGAAGAYVGDLVTYAVLRFAGEQFSQRVAWLRAEARAAAIGRFQRQISAHELRTLLLSRLIPGGRIPVLLAAALGGYSMRRYVVADLGAALVWSAVYAGIGVAGRSIFPQTWQGVLAAVVVVVLAGMVPSAWRRLVTGRRREAAAS